MSEKDAFANLKGSKEEEYFYKKEKELIERMRQRADHEAERQHMGASIGVADEEILRNLQELGYTRETVMLLHLVPLVQVAWAEGKVTSRERNLIFDAARLHGVTEGSPAYCNLRAWLDERPAEEFFEKTLRVVAAMLEGLPSEKREARKRDLVSFCTQIAEVSGGVIGFVGLGPSICREEQETLERIAAELERN